MSDGFGVFSEVVGDYEDSNENKNYTLKINKDISFFLQTYILKKNQVIFKYFITTWKKLSEFKLSSFWRYAMFYKWLTIERFL